MLREESTMLPDFKLETYFSKWEFTARYHMCASDVESMTVTELLALASDDDIADWDALRLGYTETFGAPELRQAIADTYESMDASNILTFAGAEEGIFAAMNVLLEAGDHALVVTPNYQAAETIPSALCDVTGIPLDPTENWNLDLDAVRNALKPNTRLISINFPHNPTGTVIDRSTLDGLIDIAAARGIRIFSDEVYRLLERDDSLRLPQLADVYDGGVSLNVMSKAYGLPGLRIGWIACRDHRLLTRMERLKHYLSICNSAPAEILARIALKASDSILGRNRDIIRSNLGLLDEFFDEFAGLFEWSVPDGGCIGYPRYLGKQGVEEFCRQLVEESGVLLLPASVFASALTETPTDRFRIGFGRFGMADGLAAMRRYLRGG
jgi:aspartate/methionine/tyrosine aminotransferase